MTKRIVLAFLAGVLSTLGYVVHLGGERIAEFGIKLAAFEQSYVWESAPRMVEASATVVPIAVRATKRAR